MDTQTKQDEMKAKVITIARELLNTKKEDIESGIEEGIYEESENMETLKEIENNLHLLDEFEKSRPDVYIFVVGGNIQGASATCDIGIEIYDKDNYNAAEGQEKEDMETPEQWNEAIEKMTEDKEIKPIY